jgi:RNA polymerase sigma factor (sigma-70 family)
MVEARAQFMELVAEIRPELHRYCARMLGNVIDGEDLVQDTLAKAFYAFAEMPEPLQLRAWLFRIAHNAAMDFLRRYERKNVDLVADIPEVGDSTERGPDPALVELALTAFVSLPPAQRSAVILKDVLGHSLEETASTMGNTVLAVKGALVRARANIAASKPSANTSAPAAISSQLTEDEKRRLQRYADLFNARDWDGLRSLLGEEARVDVVSRRRDRPAVTYYGTYAEIAPAEGLRAEAGVVDGTPAIAVYRATSTRPAYFLRLTWERNRIVHVQDYYWVPYIAAEARFTSA